MRKLVFIFGVVLSLTTPCSHKSFSQDKPAASDAIPLTVPAGVPLHVVLDKNLPFKHVGAPVKAHTVDPIFVFDHLVIPPGSQGLGLVVQVESASPKQRGLAIGNGDFSPLRKAKVDFDTLMIKDGSRLTLHTVVTQGAPNMVHLVAVEQGKKKGRVSQAMEQARQHAKAREQQTLNEVLAPGKLQRVKEWLWSQFPCHKPKIVKGTHFTAELKSPLELIMR